MLRKMSDQRGDTIIEVLIAIVVVSMVLVAAYDTTMRNVNGIQDTQEHSEALQLAQAQLEALHNASTQPPNNDCFPNNGGAPVSGNSCLVDASGNPTTGEPQFKLDITQVSPGTFSAAVTWDSIAQPGQTDNVTLFYQP